MLSMRIKHTLYMQISNIQSLPFYRPDPVVATQYIKLFQHYDKFPLLLIQMLILFCCSRSTTRACMLAFSH